MNHPSRFLAGSHRPVLALLARGAARFDRLGIAVFAVLLSACPELGNGERSTEQRELADFTAVDNDGDLDVLIEQGETFDVTVAIDKNLIDRVETSVVGGTLRIRTRGQVGHLLSGPHVRITMPVLTSVRLTGDGDLDAFEFKDSESVELRLSGDGDLAWHGDALEITAVLSGDGDLQLEGTTESLDLRVSGDGDAQARACVAETALVQVSGDGSASVDVRGDLDAQVHGDGDLDVYGDPHFVRRTSSGDGDIHVH